MLPLEFRSVEELVVDLGHRLRKIRLRKNVKQQALADKAGVSEKALRNLEAGKGSSVETFVRVMKALGLERGIELLAPDVSVDPIAMLKRRYKKKPQQRVLRSRRVMEKKRRALLEEFMEEE
jgi:transcriptional regulator with XRE-family HTH domain